MIPLHYRNVLRGTFHFPVDPDRDPIVTAVNGVFGEEVHAQYLTARAAAFRQLRCGSTEHLSRSDLRGMNTQSQEIVNAFSAMLAQPTCQSKRLGLVIGSSRHGCS